MLCVFISDENLIGSQSLYEAESIPRLRNLGDINANTPNRQTISAVNQRPRAIYNAFIRS